MDAIALRKLSRSELQKLARANDVKANLKSATIITLLLERHPDGAPASRRSGRASIVIPAELRPGDDTAEEKPSNDVPAKDENEPVPEAADAGPSNGKPPLRKANDPASEARLIRAVNIMSFISERDREHFAKLERMRTLVAQARRQATDIRNLVRAETGRRTRVEAYLRYWVDIDHEWSQDSIWGNIGNVRLKLVNGNWDELSTDEESFLTLTCDSCNTSI